MHVIFNTRPLLFDKTGIGYYTYNLYRGLLQSKEVEVCPTIGNPSVRTLGFMSSFAQMCRRVFGDSVLKFTVPAGDFLISRVERKNKVSEADIYHEPNYDKIPEGKWKSVANIYDLSFLNCPEYLPERVLQKCKLNLDNILKADRFIVNTEAIKKEVTFSMKIPEERIDVISLAPSADYYPVNRDSMEGKIYVNKYTQSEYILCVGTIEPRKNIPVLLKAFRLLREKYRFHLKLILAGEKGWGYEDILKMSHQLGIQDDVIFTGYIDEKTILYLYNYATAVVYPSIYEGFGLPVIEAMSCGVPVLISDIPSLREISGDAAIVFNPSDHEELAHKIEKVLSSEYLMAELRRKGLQKVSEYSWDKVVSSTIQTYRKALEK